ncbi:MAG: 50S ribosomal protein L25 [Minisyncoccia bacterium]
MVLLEAKIRDKKNDKPKKLRRKNLIPAILYGAEIKNILISIDKKEFPKIFREVGESEFLDLIVKDGEREEKYKALIYDMQIDPLTREILHVDFFVPSKIKKVKLTVPILFEGVSKAVKEKGGILIKEIQELEIKAPLNKILKEIKINLEDLKEIDDKICVKDLKLDEEITILRRPDEIIVNVVAPEKEKTITQEKTAETQVSGALE